MNSIYRYTFETTTNDGSQYYTEHMAETEAMAWNQFRQLSLSGMGNSRIVLTIQWL